MIDIKIGIYQFILLGSLCQQQNIAWARDKFNYSLEIVHQTASTIPTDINLEQKVLIDNPKFSKQQKHLSTFTEVENSKADIKLSNESKSSIKNIKRNGYHLNGRHKDIISFYKQYGHSNNEKSFSTLEKLHKWKLSKDNTQHNLHNHKPYNHGHINYYENLNTNGNQFHSGNKIRSYHHNHGHHMYKSNELNRGNKWPHLSRVQYKLYEDEIEDQLPPYIKKYIRRNNQLLNLLEGTLPSPTKASSERKLRRQHHTHYHNHKKRKWIIEDLFEEQRSNPNDPNMQNDQQPITLHKGNSISTNLRDEYKSIKENELPGQDISISREENFINYNNNLSSHNSSQTLPIEIKTNNDTKNLAKNNNFIYHRIASPRIVGTGEINLPGIKKQRLPFVAITDRRLETSKTKSRDFK